MNVQQLQVVLRATQTLDVLIVFQVFFYLASGLKFTLSDVISFLPDNRSGLEKIYIQACINYLIIPHFKDKSFQSLVFNFISLKLTLAKNFWQCLEQHEIQPVCQKNTAPLIYFQKKNLLI